MSDQNMLIHLAAGGLAGTIGSVLTCPLEVVKTRNQASSASFVRLHNHNLLFHDMLSKSPAATYPRIGNGIYLHMRSIVEHEGFGALFKGLLPNIVGVAPYRAIYFYSYANAKKHLSNVFGEQKTLLHIVSAYCAGFTAVTITNPVWFVKTRLQLDESKCGMSTADVVKKIFKTKGILGFYKGISASYFGITETALYFVIYEKLKSLNKEMTPSSENESLNFSAIFFSAGFSKTLASCLCYPHEVARTRLREEGSKYNGFFQTLGLVVREEGVRGLYKGMATHLIRQIPNTAIVMTSYELLVRYSHKFLSEQSNE